jgi:beta-phosphoglucomutase
VGNYKAFLFDLDGVIVDTAKYHYLAWKRLADELGVFFDEEKNEAFKGVSRAKCMELLAGWGGLSLSEDEMVSYAARKNGWYVEYLAELDESELLPGALDTLKEAKRRGVKCAICSASKNTMTILARLGIASYFDSIVDGNRASKAKPDPQVFLMAAAELGVTREEAVIFEDSLAGVQAGNAEGIYVVGIGEEKNLPGAGVCIPDLARLDLDKLLK